MNHALIARWNEVVGDDDTVWVLGDFALGTIEDTVPMTAPGCFMATSTNAGQHGRMINVGVDATGLRPISETEIARLITGGPARRAQLVGS